MVRTGCASGGTQDEILQDKGDANGKGRGALRRVLIAGLVFATATILVGVSTKSDDETLVEWGTDVAEVGAHDAWRNATHGALRRCGVCVWHQRRWRTRPILLMLACRFRRPRLGVW